MVEVNSKHGLREYFLGFSNYNFQHPFVGVFPCAFRQLNDKGSLRLMEPLNQPKVCPSVDVVGTNSVLPVRKLKEV